jgi:hypothetical protein
MNMTRFIFLFNPYEWLKDILSRDIKDMPINRINQLLPHHRRQVRWPNFHGQKNLLNLEINYGSEKAKREPTQV